MNKKMLAEIGLEVIIKNAKESRLRVAVEKAPEVKEAKRHARGRLKAEMRDQLAEVERTIRANAQEWMKE